MFKCSSHSARVIPHALVLLTASPVHRVLEWGSATHLAIKTSCCPSIADKSTEVPDQGVLFPNLPSTSPPPHDVLFNNTLSVTIPSLCDSCASSFPLNNQLQLRQKHLDCNLLFDSNLRIANVSTRTSWHSTVTALRAAAFPQLSPKVTKPRESTKLLMARRPVSSSLPAPPRDECFD